MTLFVHRATNTDVLADGLAELLATPLADAFAEEVVAVPAKGVERWLAQRLSHTLGAGPRGGDGVCAGVRFLNPHSLVALVLGIERDDPWHPDRLAWPVLRAIDESLDEDWAAPLAAHLGTQGVDNDTEVELRRGRRYAVARRLAGLLSSYAEQRPSLVADWRAGGGGDGLGGALPDDLAWQPHLWRAVLELVGAEAPDARHDRVVSALRAGGEPESLELPGRLSLFGHTRIARSEVAVLAALGEHRDVHLWLPQASSVAWDRLSPIVSGGPVPRASDESAVTVEHPLLASLGRDIRELQRTLAPAAAVDRPLGALLARATGPDRAGDSPRRGAPDEPATLLGWLQGDLRRDHQPEADEVALRVLSADDESVQVHACHGRGRQVQVLRDVLAGLLQDRPDLEPRDILVMCPDIDAYAPLVHAGFGLGEVVRDLEAHPAHGLRVLLADRAPRHTNPLLGLAARLVELAGSRLTTSEVLDLARSAPVRRRFGLDDDALDRIGGWVEQVAVRWGLDAEHRGRYALANFGQNTWRTGLDRVLTGAALDGQDATHLGHTLALDDLDSGDIDLAGRLAELVERLGATLRGLHGCQHAREWTQTLLEGVRGLADVPADDEWQVAQLERELARITDAARRDTGSTTLALSDIRALLEEHLAGRATRSSFRTGTLTICTMVPMRSVPHRVVCLVGLDDGIFPRTTSPDGDDALARLPVTGERDTRAEDRQLLLDAVMSARDTLVITYTGADEHSGAERPPAVPLGELLDALVETATRPEGAVPLVRHHPLQPYDVRNLGGIAPHSPRLLPDDEPFSFDPTALSGAQAALTRPTVPDAEARVVGLVDEPLPDRAEESPDIALEDLQRFLAQPAQAFLRQRLGLLLPDQPEEPVEGIPIELDGLERWKIGDRMLRAVLAGAHPDDTRQQEEWRGSVPPGELGRAVLDEVDQRVRNIARAAMPHLETVGEVIDIDLALPNGRRLTGTIGPLHGTPSGMITTTYSTVRAKQRLRSWVTSLVLAAHGQTWPTSHVIGQMRQGRNPRVVHLTHGPVDPETALTLLSQLVDVFDRGMRSPLPLGVQSASAFAESFISSGDEQGALADATKKWESSTGWFTFTGEQDDPAFRRVFGHQARLVDIAGVPGDDELWSDGIRTRFGQFALRVWLPLLTTGPESKSWL